MKVKVCTYGNIAKENRLESIIAIIDLDSTDINDLRFGADKHYAYGLEIYNTNIWNNLTFTGQCKIKSEVPYYDPDKFYVYILSEHSTEQIDNFNNNIDKFIDNVSNRMKKSAAIFRNYVEDGYDKVSYMLQKSDDDKERFNNNEIIEKTKTFVNDVVYNNYNKLKNIKNSNDILKDLSERIETAIEENKPYFDYKNENSIQSKTKKLFNNILNKVNEKKDSNKDCEAGK